MENGGGVVEELRPGASTHSEPMPADNSSNASLALTPQSAQRVGEITASMTDFMQPLNDTKPLGEMVQFRSGIPFTNCL